MTQLTICRVRLWRGKNPVSLFYQRETTLKNGLKTAIALFYLIHSCYARYYRPSSVQGSHPSAQCQQAMAAYVMAVVLFHKQRPLRSPHWIYSYSYHHQMPCSPADITNRLCLEHIHYFQSVFSLPLPPFLLYKGLQMTIYRLKMVRQC